MVYGAQHAVLELWLGILIYTVANLCTVYSCHPVEFMIKSNYHICPQLVKGVLVLRSQIVESSDNIQLLGYGS